MVEATPKAKYLRHFGHAIRALRTERGWSQEHLADVAGLHRNFIGGIERGVRNPTITVAMQIAQALEVEPGALLAPHAPPCG